MVGLRNKNLKRILLVFGISLLMACASIFSLLPTTKASSFDVWDGASVSTSLAGSGTEHDPYLIGSAADLAYFNASVNQDKYYKLTANIDWNGNSWSPIGIGFLDGGNHTIKGFAPNVLTVNNRQHFGLFTAIIGGISNLKIEYAEDININASNGLSFSLLATGQCALVDNVHITSTGSITINATNATEKTYVGGLVCSSVGDITNSSVSMSAVVNSNAISYVGGLGASVAGSFAGSGTNNSSANVNLTVNSNANIYVGGLFGEFGMSSNSLIEDCYSRGSITASAPSGNGGKQYASGIAGKFDAGSTINRVYTTMDVCANSSYLSQGNEIKNSVVKSCQGHDYYQCNGHCQGHPVAACEGGAHYMCQNSEYPSSETVVRATCQDSLYRYQCINCWYSINQNDGTLVSIKIEKHPAIFTIDDHVETDNEGNCISTTATRDDTETKEHIHGSDTTVEALEAAGCSNYTTDEEIVWTTVECPAYGVIVPYDQYTSSSCAVCGAEMTYVYDQESCSDSSCYGWNENADTYYHSNDEMNLCDNKFTHNSGYDGSQGNYFAVEIYGCDNQELVTSGNCGSSHTYYVSYDPPRYESYTVNTGYVDIIDSGMTGNCLAFFSNESALTASHTLTAPANYGRTLAQLQTASTYSGWTDFDRYWIIKSSINDGLPVQRSTLSLRVKTAAMLVDDANSEILPIDAQSWNEVTTTGDGYYLSTDSGAELNETVTVGASYDDGKYQFVGWARYDGDNYTIVSNSTPYNFEMTTANEGEWFALFREVNYDLTTSICVIKSDGTEITDEVVLKQYVELNTTKNGSSYSTGKIKVLDELKFTYEYINTNADFFAFDHWRVNGIQITEDNINDILDNGEVNDAEHYLYTQFYNNVIANSKSNGTLDVVAVFKPVQYQVVVKNMNSSIGTLAVDDAYDGDVEMTAEGNLIIKNIDVYSTIPSVKATTENAITGWYYFNAEFGKVEMFTFDQICKEMRSPTTDLRTEIVDNNALVANYTLNFYVEFKTIYKVSVVTEVDFGTYTEYDKDCLAYVYQGGSAERLTEIYVYEGQQITFNYIEMSSWGYDFLGFFDKEIGASTATYTKRPITGTITNETIVYGVYLRQSVDFSVKAYDQSANLLYDFIDVDNTILDVSISASGSKFISQYERYNQGEDNEQWLFTLSEGKIQTIDSFTRYNDYLSISLSLQNQMNNTYKILGIKLLNADASTEQINNSAYRVSDSGANRVSDTIRVNDVANRCLYLIYTRLDMSVQLASEITGSGKTALDAPCENLLLYQDEVVNGNRVQDILYGETVIFKSKAKVGFQFYGWKLPDGTIIQKSNISIDMEGNISELIADPDYNILTLSAFDNSLKGIYTAVYSKIAYKFVVENVAGDNVFSIDGKSYTNGVDEIYINQTAGISANISPSKNYFGLSSQQNTSAEYFNTIQLTEILIALADDNNIIRLYQVYEDNFLLTINLNDRANATFELFIDGNVVEYTGARYVVKNNKVEIKVTTADHYHFTILGVEDSCITENGAVFNMTADTTIAVNVEIDKHKLEFEVEDGYDGGAILTGDGEYSYGQIAHINATINSGFYFVRWTIDDGNGTQSKLVSEFDFTISSDTKCKIILKHRYTITTQVNNSFGASITPTFELNENEIAQIVVTLNPGYSLQGWQIDGEPSDLVGTTINIIGEKTCTYTAVISQDRYYVNAEELIAVYGESGFTISAPLNGEYYVYNEQIDINLLTPLFMLRLNKFSANNVVLATNSSVSNESQLSVSLTAGDKTYFIGYTTTIHIDYTRIYALNIVKTQTEANDSVLNEIYYIKKLVSGNTTTYHILDGTVVNIDTKDNAKYIFNKYELKVGEDYEPLSSKRETLYTVNSDCEIRVDYLGALYNIEFVNHVLNETDDEITDFDQSWISNHTYSFKNSAGQETLEHRYGSEITISPVILPYGLTVHHFKFDGVDSVSNSSITVVMNKAGNITVDVYFSRVAIDVSVANSVGGAITQIQGKDIDSGNTIYSVTGEGTYYIGDKVTIKLGEIQAYKSYFINNGWSVNGNKLKFENRVAKFNGNTYRVENNSRSIIFTLVPFNNDTNLVLSPDLDYVEFSINVALYFNRTLYNATTENPLANATIIVNDVNTESSSAKVHYKDKIEIAVTYNPSNVEAYNNVYEFDEMTCNSYKITNNVAIDANQNVIYSIAEFVSGNKGNYRFKYVSTTSSFKLAVTPELAVNDSALYQNKAEYAQGDAVIIGVSESKINAGYRFLGWYYNDELKADSLEYQFEYNVSYHGNTFVAKFEAIDYTFEFKSVVNGSVCDSNDNSLVGTRTYNALNGFTDSADLTSKQIKITPDLANGYCIDDVVYYASNDEANTHSIYDLLNIDSDGTGIWDFDFGLVSELISQDDIATTSFVIQASFKHIVLRVNVQLFCDGLASTQTDLIDYSISGNEGHNIQSFDIEYGENFTLTINALKDGYRLVPSEAIKYDGEIQAIESSSSTIQVKRNGILAIYIVRIEYTINLSYVKDYGVVSVIGKAKVGESISFVLNSVNTGYDFLGFYRGSRVDENNLLSNENRFEFTFEIEYDQNTNIITTYNYYAGFAPKSITFVVKSYDLNKSPLENGLISYKVDNLTYLPLNGATFSYGQKIELVVSNITGYTFARFGDDSVIKGTTVVVNDEMLKVEGDKEVILIYSANVHNINIYHNMYGAIDKNGEPMDISPANSLRYSKAGESNGFGYVNRMVSAEYSSTIRVMISSILSDWKFIGLYEIITVDGQTSANLLVEGSNSGSYAYNYVVKDTDAEIVAVFAPNIDFINFDEPNERRYAYDYTSNPISIETNKISMSTDNRLRELMTITYNGATNVPTNAGEYRLAIKFDSARIPGLKDYVSPTATLKISPIELKFVYDGRISKVYDGTSSILVYSGLRIADGILRENDVNWITISTADANFSANFVLAEKDVYYNRVDVADNYSVRFENIKLVSKVGDYSSKINNYVFPNNSNTIIFNNIGSIVKREIEVQNILVVNKIFDDSTIVKFRDGYSLNNAILNASQKVKIGDVIDDVNLDYENINLRYSTKEVGDNVSVIAEFLNNSTGLIGAKANNYTLKFPRLSGYKIHPNQISVSGDYGTITIIDVDNNLYFPLDLQIKVTTIRQNSESYASIYGLIEPQLSNNKNFGIGYNIALYSNGFEYKIINGAVMIKIITPDDLKNSKVDDVYKLNTAQDNTSIESMTISTDVENIFFRTSELGTFVLVATRNPVPLWVIIVISVIVALAILFLCLYLFVIVPKKREKAYANFSKIN